jgi:hypothetical protein
MKHCDPKYLDAFNTAEKTVRDIHDALCGVRCVSKADARIVSLYSSAVIDFLEAARQVLIETGYTYRENE